MSTRGGVRKRSKPKAFKRKKIAKAPATRRPKVKTKAPKRMRKAPTRTPLRTAGRGTIIDKGAGLVGGKGGGGGKGGPKPPSGVVGAVQGTAGGVSQGAASKPAGGRGGAPSYVPPANATYNPPRKAATSGSGSPAAPKVVVPKQDYHEVGKAYRKRQSEYEKTTAKIQEAQDTYDAAETKDERQQAAAEVRKESKKPSAVKPEKPVVAKAELKAAEAAREVQRVQDRLILEREAAGARAEAKAKKHRPAANYTPKPQGSKRPKPARVGIGPVLERGVAPLAKVSQKQHRAAAAGRRAQATAKRAARLVRKAKVNAIFAREAPKKARREIRREGRAVDAGGGGAWGESENRTTPAKRLQKSAQRYVSAKRDESAFEKGREKHKENLRPTVRRQRAYNKKVLQKETKGALRETLGRKPTELEIKQTSQSERRELQTRAAEQKTELQYFGAVQEQGPKFWKRVEIAQRKGDEKTRHMADTYLATKKGRTKEDRSERLAGTIGHGLGFTGKYEEERAQNKVQAERQARKNAPRTVLGVVEAFASDLGDIPGSVADTIGMTWRTGKDLKQAASNVVAKTLGKDPSELEDVTFEEAEAAWKSYTKGDPLYPYAQALLNGTSLADAARESGDRSLDHPLAALADIAGGVGAGRAITPSVGRVARPHRVSNTHARTPKGETRFQRVRETHAQRRAHRADAKAEGRASRVDEKLARDRADQIIKNRRANGEKPATGSWKKEHEQITADEIGKLEAARGAKLTSGPEGSRAQAYSRAAPTRAIQKLREDVRAATGRDPFASSKKGEQWRTGKTVSAFRKAQTHISIGVVGSIAALKHGIEQGNLKSVGEFFGSDVRGKYYDVSAAHAAAGLLATDRVRPETALTDLNELRQTYDQQKAEIEIAIEKGKGSHEPVDFDALSKRNGELGRSLGMVDRLIAAEHDGKSLFEMDDIKTAADEMLRYDAMNERELVESKFMDPESARFRAAIQRPLAHGQVKWVEKGDTIRTHSYDGEVWTTVHHKDEPAPEGVDPDEELAATEAAAEGYESSTHVASRDGFVYTDRTTAQGQPRYFHHTDAPEKPIAYQSPTETGKPPDPESMKFVSGKAQSLRDGSAIAGLPIADHGLLDSLIQRQGRASFSRLTQRIRDQLGDRGGHVYRGGNWEPRLRKLRRSGTDWVAVKTRYAKGEQRGKGLVDEAVPGDSDVILLPRQAFVQLKKEMERPHGITGYGQWAQRLYVGTVLPLSSRWHVGNAIDLSTRMLIAGVIPQDRKLLMAFYEQAREALGEQRARELTINAKGAHFGSTRRANQGLRLHHITEESKHELVRKFGRWQSGTLTNEDMGKGGWGDSPSSAPDYWLHQYERNRMGEVVGHAGKLREAGFDLAKWYEDPLGEAAAGRALRSMGKQLGLEMKNHIALANRMLREMDADPSLADEFARRTVEIIGDYAASPFARKFVQPLLPFYRWMIEANKLIFYHFPAKHPAKLALALQAGMLSQDVVEMLGLQGYSEAEGGVFGIGMGPSAFLTNALPAGDGFYRPTAPFTSMGEVQAMLDSPWEYGLTRPLPYLQSVVSALAGFKPSSKAGSLLAAALGHRFPGIPGLDDKGILQIQKLNPGEDSWADRVAIARAELAKSFVVGAPQAAAIAEQGGAPQGPWIEFGTGPLGLLPKFNHDVIPGTEVPLYENAVLNPLGKSKSLEDLEDQKAQARRKTGGRSDEAGFEVNGEAFKNGPLGQIPPEIQQLIHKAGKGKEPVDSRFTYFDAKGNKHFIVREKVPGFPAGVATDKLHATPRFKRAVPQKLLAIEHRSEPTAEQDLAGTIGAAAKMFAKDTNEAVRAIAYGLQNKPGRFQPLGPGDKEKWITQADLPKREKAASGGVPDYVPSKYVPMIERSAQKWGVDPEILAAQLRQESGFDEDIGSPAGAQGIAQFMPETAASYGVDVYDPESSIDGQAHYMHDLLEQTGGDYRRALAGYNAGGGAIDEALGEDGGSGYPETLAYVDSILGAVGDSPSAPVNQLPKAKNIRAWMDPRSRRPVGDIKAMKPEMVRALVAIGKDSGEPVRFKGGKGNYADVDFTDKQMKLLGKHGLTKAFTTSEGLDDGLQGSQSVVQEIMGKPVTGDKEPGHSAGGMHDPAVLDAYAQDIGSSGANPAEHEPEYSQGTLDKIIANLRARGADVPDMELAPAGTVGPWWEGEVDGYQVELGVNDNGQAHIHLGAKKVSDPTWFKEQPNRWDVMLAEDPSDPTTPSGPVGFGETMVAEAPSAPMPPPKLMKRAAQLHKQVRFPQQDWDVVERRRELNYALLTGQMTVLEWIQKLMGLSRQAIDRSV